MYIYFCQEEKNWNWTFILNYKWINTFYIEHKNRYIYILKTLSFSDLLQWIERTIEALGDRTFANSLEGVRQQLIQFANYRTVEKPPK